MKWADKIKARIGTRMLNDKISTNSRHAKLCTVNDAKTIGILYDATNYISFEIVRDLVKKLTSSSVTISALGYVDSKKLIDHYLYRKGFDFFSRNDLNWYYKPVSQTAEQFINQPFDILLNLSLDFQFPIQYISSLSIANFKAGRYTAEDASLDFMIDIEKEKETMRKLHAEIVAEKKSLAEGTDLNPDIQKKTEIELQLNFLITQLLHYLSILKK